MTIEAISTSQPKRYLGRMLKSIGPMSASLLSHRTIARLLLYVKLDPTTIGGLPSFARDVREIGHYGTGDLELSIRNPDDFELAKQYIELAYQNVGG